MAGQPAPAPAPSTHLREMEARVRSLDWSRTSLGPMDLWPQSLKLTVELILRSSFPMAVRWGPDFVLIYNDGYKLILGEKHPRALGAAFRDAWPEVQPRLGPLHADILEGRSEGMFSEDLPLTIRRHGERTEEACFTVSYSPIPDATSPTGIGGVLVTAVETTERVRAESALRQTEQALRQSNEALAKEREAVRDTNRRLLAESDDLRRLFEQAPSFMAVLSGPDHVFTLANESYLKLIGNRDVLGKPVRDALPEIEGQGFVNLLDHVLTTGEPYVGRASRVRVQSEPGTSPAERLLDFVYQPIKADNGRVTGIFVQGHDLTELMRAEEALKESEERFRLVAESAPVMLWMGDENGKCLYLNEAQRDFWGVQPDKLSEFDWGGTLLPEDQAKLYEPFSRAMSEHTSFSVEARYRRADGAIRLLHTEARPRFGLNNEFLGMIGVNIDTTDSRGLETALRDETRALEILNRTGAAIAGELDLDRVVQAVTDAGVELSGAEFGAFFHNVVDEKGESYMLYTLSGAPREAFEKFPMPRSTGVFAPTFKGEGIVRSDDITKDPRYGKSSPYFGMPKGHLPVCSYLAVPVKSRSGEVVGGLFFGHSRSGMFDERAERLMAGLAAQASIAIDNARLFQAAQRVEADLERRVAQAVEERDRAEAAFRQSQKMEAIGQLTGGVAHDFNNLLTVIRSSADLLRKPDLSEEKRRRYLDAISETTDRAANLTSQLLAFARRQPLKAVVFDLVETVRRTVEFIRPVVGARIEIVMAFACDSYLINADPNQFETALINVAANARDAMAGEGRIEIRIEPTAQIPGASAEGSGSFAAISITDQGTGIDPKNIEHIFEPFFTTKEVGKGTGLGLSQVYGFVKQSGGDVRIESKLNVGTTITLYLPQANSGLAPAVKNVTDPAEQKRLATRGRILVVEDNREVGTFATQLLSDLGYTTTWVESAREALSLFEGGQCHFDLVFSDVVMPGGMSGVDLANELRRRMPTLPVVLTSGYSETLAEGQGANFELLRKPYSVESLSGLIRKALQDGRNPEAEPR